MYIIIVQKHTFVNIFRFYTYVLYITIFATYIKTAKSGVERSRFLLLKFSRCLVPSVSFQYDQHKFVLSYQRLIRSLAYQVLVFRLSR